MMTLFGCLSVLLAFTAALADYTRRNNVQQ